MWAAKKLYLVDRIADCVRFTVQKATDGRASETRLARCLSFAIPGAVQNILEPNVHRRCQAALPCKLVP
jgi:hypothetical protein